MFDEFAQLDEQLVRAGIDPVVADGMEIWRVAAALGKNHPADPEPAEAPAQGVNPAVLRAQAQERGAPEPTAARPSPGPDARLRTLIPSLDSRERRKG